MGRNGGNSPTVILVEEHQIFREGVRDLMRANGIRVAGEADSAADAVALAADLKPGVALTDLRLSDASGFDATRRILAVSPGTKVVVLTASEDEHDLSEALAAGACGYLLKHCPPQDIAEGVLAAADGGSPLSPPIAALLLARLREIPDRSAPMDGDRLELTERELEVLVLIADGKNNAEIAGELVISQHTVKNHVSGVLAKLRVENRIQAAVYAVRQGLV